MFAHAAAHACVFEAKLRLLADNTPELERHSLESAKILLRNTLAHFGASLGEDDAKLLELCVRLRNDLLHMSLSRATGKLKCFGAELDLGHVTKISLETGETTPVEKTSTRTGKVYGWLLESATSGAYDQGAKFFLRGIEVIERLADASVNEPM